MASFKKMFPWRVRLFIGAVVLAAAGLTAQTARSIPPLALSEWAAMLVFGPLPVIPVVIVASWFPWVVMKVCFKPARMVEVVFNVPLDIVAAVTARLVPGGHTVTHAGAAG